MPQSFENGIEPLCLHEWGYLVCICAGSNPSTEEWCVDAVRILPLSERGLAPLEVIDLLLATLRREAVCLFLCQASLHAAFSDILLSLQDQQGPLDMEHFMTLAIVVQSHIR